MLKSLLAATALVASLPAYGAVIVTYTPGASPIPPGTVIIEDFEDETGGTPGQSIGTNAFVFNTSVGGQAAQPAFNSTGNFGAVLGTPTLGSYQINFATSTIFSFALGSLDTYNDLRLFLSDGSFIDYFGAGINQGVQANGDQVSPNTNGRVTYTVTGGGPFIVGARFQSTQNSFEFDNLAIQAVPEPATWMMMILGFGAVGYAMRRRRSKGSLALA
jgi:hypothetical protein